MGWFVLRYGPHLIENVHQGVNIICNMPCRLMRPHYVHHPQLMGACTWTTAQKCAMLSGAICLGCVCDFVGGAVSVGSATLCGKRLGGAAWADVE